MIKADVIESHIAQHPSELEFLRRLEQDFDITWGKRYVEFNAQVSTYFLKPLPHVSEAFGFEQEICLIYSSYPQMQARTIQALDNIMLKYPAFGRVDQANAFLISEDKNLYNWLRDYAASNPQSRIIVGFTASDLKSAKGSWDVRNSITQQLYSRDLFDYTLPIDNDTFFFGRSSDVASHVDAIRRSENRGLFGLRKSGKTSLLFKIRRECDRSEILTVYVDCKLPHIYRKGWGDLLNDITDEIADNTGLSRKGWSGRKDPSDRFFRMVEKLGGKKVCVIFDEIEYISFYSPVPDGKHWHKDFIPFWQTLWATQSQYRNLSYIVTGVNASTVEVDSIDGIQNPMFGVVKHRYLEGFDLIELRQMLRTLGRRMGLRFSEEATEFLHQRYGGHPLVTRMICSHIHSQVRVEDRERPFLVTGEYIEAGIEEREEEVIIYCNHIVSELKHSYINEYELLEMLAIDDVEGFNLLSDEEGYIRHLKGYGLVDFSKPFKPKFKIPVLQKFMSREWRKKNRADVAIYVTPTDRRAVFVKSRTNSIIRDLRLLDKQFSALGYPVLYAGSGPSEAEKFANSEVSNNEQALTSFLIQSCRSLTEPIDKVGKSIGRGKRYFYDDIRLKYPDLWDALNRIRAYRNWLGHTDLNDEAEKNFEKYINNDLKGRFPEDIEDGFFLMQSACLNKLALAIQTTFAMHE